MLWLLGVSEIDVTSRAVSYWKKRLARKHLDWELPLKRRLSLNHCQASLLRTMGDI